MKKRNKELTKDKILEAVDTILQKHGVWNIGVNKVAKQAGLDKQFRWNGWSAKRIHCQ